MLRKIFKLLLARRLWIYLAVTTTVALPWGFVAGLIALGLTWTTITVARNLLSSDDAFDMLHGGIGCVRNAQANANAKVTAIGANEGIAASMPFDMEMPNPAAWGKEKTDEYLYDSSFSHVPGNIWHRPNRGTE